MTEQQISTRLLQLGFQPNLRGYHYILAAVKLYLVDSKRKICTEIYPVIAGQYNVKPSCIERAIRHSIQVAHELNSPAWQEFCVTGWHNGGRPTNSWVLCMLAEQFRLKEVS